MGSIEGRMDSLEGRMGSIEGRMDSLENRMDSLEMDMGQVKTTLVTTQNHLERIDQQIDSINGNIIRVEQQMNFVNGNVTRMDQQLHSVNSSLTRIDSEVRSISENVQFILKKSETEFTLLKKRLDKIEEHLSNVEKLSLTQTGRLMALNESLLDLKAEWQLQARYPVQEREFYPLQLKIEALESRVLKLEVA